jgi:hypothetical protein
MRIIKQGKLPSERVTIAKCRNCGTEVEVSQHECKDVSNARNGAMWTFVCPLEGCYSSIYIYKWE